MKRETQYTRERKRSPTTATSTTTTIAADARMIMRLHNEIQFGMTNKLL
jgi:hypothetical protein